MYHQLFIVFLHEGDIHHLLCPLFLRWSFSHENLLIPCLIGMRLAIDLKAHACNGVSLAKSPDMI